MPASTSVNNATSSTSSLSLFSRATKRSKPLRTCTVITDALLAEFDPEVVERAVALVDRAEYKRRQAPPGVKLRPKAFGRDRRTPITNRWAD